MKQKKDVGNNGPSQNDLIHKYAELPESHSGANKRRTLRGIRQTIFDWLR